MGRAGAAQKQIRSFVIAKARRAPSTSALAAELLEQGFPSTEKTLRFAEQLVSRFSQKKQLSVHSPFHVPPELFKPF
jgi:hypothetical protein